MVGHGCRPLSNVTVAGVHTETENADLGSVAMLLERMHGARPRELQVHRRVLRGGLEAAAVARIGARYVNHRGERKVFTLVIKHLLGVATREVEVYQQLVTAGVADLGPRLLAARRLAPGRAVLYLEFLCRTRAWPWWEPRAAQRVLDLVARLHATVPTAVTTAGLAEWDYEAELQRASVLTVDQLDFFRARPDLAPLRKSFRSAQRVAAALPAIRRQLLTYPRLGQRVIHGDLHPGNALMRRRQGRDQAVLLDWGRARLGSPLEDVSSWLQSLGCWEPEARRRHDTLLSGYLSARGIDVRLGSDLREAYWLAGASNALAGALLYQVSVISDDRVTGARRARAVQSAREWLRVLRRADALWR
jgi:hypothetical protein